MPANSEQSKKTRARTARWNAEKASTKNRSSAAVTRPAAKTATQRCAANPSSIVEIATARRSTWRGRVAARQASAANTATPSIPMIEYPAGTPSSSQRIEPVGIGHAELAADVKNRNPHHEDRHKGVEQNAQLDQQGRLDDGDYPK